MVEDIFNDKPVIRISGCNVLIGVLTKKEVCPCEWQRSGHYVHMTCHNVLCHVTLLKIEDVGGLKDCHEYIQKDVWAS